MPERVSEVMELVDRGLVGELAMVSVRFKEILR